MRILVIVATWIGAFSVLDVVSFDGGYRHASVQWAESQGRDIRYGVRSALDKAFGK